MEAGIRLLNTVLPIVYCLAVVAYAVDFLSGQAGAARAARRIIRLALALHFAYLGLRTALYSHVPIASTPEVLTTVALAVAVVYVYVEERTQVQSTGLFFVSFSLVLQTLSSAFISELGAFPRRLESPLFAVHTITAVLGYTAFGVSAVYGLLFLLLYHDLRRSRFGLLYQRLPALEVLAAMSLKAVGFGVAFLTVTIAGGVVWARSEFPGFTSDPKFQLTVVVWLVYLTALATHHGLHWSGRRSIAVSLVGFGLLVFSLIAARLLFHSFHVFA